MKWVLTLGVLATVATAAQAAPRTIAFYTVPRIEHAPELDGDLSDPCWQQARADTTYFEYWKPQPGPGALASELRLAYDPRGLYVAIVNHDERMSQIRATRTTRDAADLWQDDCAELYFDPAALGIGFTRFVVNSLGTQQDDRRIDAAVALKDWSGQGWRVATRSNATHWTIEAFFPWEDLGQQAQAGDLWQFNHVRYGYSSGKFQGVTWSAGGNYQSPQNFGYLLFLGSETPDAAAVVARLSEAVAPPWQLMMGQGLVVCSQRGQARWLSPETFLAETRAVLDKALTAAAEQITPGDTEREATLAALCEQADALAQQPAFPAGALDTARQLTQLHEQAEELKWQARLAKLLDDL